MSELEMLRNARKKLVGTKQTLKALEKGELRMVFIAKDAEPKVVAPLVSLCGESGVPVVYVESMGVLGKACCIEVGAAAAALPQ